MRRGRDVVLGESISAETGVNQRPAPPTPKVTIGRRFTVSPERLIGIVLYLGLERRNSDDARHPQYRSTAKHMTWEVRHDTGVCSLVEYRSTSALPPHQPRSGMAALAFRLASVTRDPAASALVRPAHKLHG